MKAIAIAIVVALAASPLAHPKEGPDALFVMKAGQAGLAEVALGNDANSLGKNESVKHFGQRMATDHTAANGKLASAARAGAYDVPGEPSVEQKAAELKLKALDSAAFDKAYASQMVKDHEEAVALFEKESSAGKDASLKAFATETLPTLKEHLKMAQDLQAAVK
jgi:putative membrane protein